MLQSSKNAFYEEQEKKRKKSSRETCAAWHGQTENDTTLASVRAKSNLKGIIETAISVSFL